MNTKELVNLLKQIDRKLQYDIFIILKKYDIQYTRNNNGIFFNLENIDENILDEIYRYLEFSTLHTNTIQQNTYVQLDSIGKNDNEVDNRLIITNEIEEYTDKTKKCTSKTLYDECEYIVKNVLNDNKTKVIRILHDIEKEKSCISKKTAINKFSVAKKKYAKQVITVNEHHDLSNLLDYDE